MSNAALMTLGIVIFLAGGALIALVPGVAGTAVGTTAGLAGLALIGWAWMRRPADESED